MDEISLRVAESAQYDVNKGVVRLDSFIIDELNLNKKGGFVEIKGDRTTVAIAGPAYLEDKNMHIIRMDGITRTNAGTGIGEKVKVRKADVKEAKRVVIAPVRKDIIVQAGPGFKYSFMGRPIVKGDIITQGRKERKNMVMSTPLDEVFDALKDEFYSDSFGLQEIKFIVVSTVPTGPVLITENTQFEVRKEAAVLKEHMVPEVTYEDVGGLSEEVKKVREMVELPLVHPEVFERMGIEAPKGVLLYGPPGTGKTLLARAVANESKTNFIVINGPEIMSKFYGESEKQLRDIFSDAEKNAPSIIFIDEIDAIAPKREEAYGEMERRVVAQLNSIMDGLKSRGKVIVIAATNIPNAIDPALRRPGRFDREIEIKVPGSVGRKKILEIHTRNVPLANDVKIERLVQMTHGYVGADLASLVKEAVMIVLRRLLPDLLKTEESIPGSILDKLVVKHADFIEALKFVRPSALREILIEKPNIRFEQVGNLERVKNKLKEAVEWPLLHPDLYQDVGIRAPRGILLFGAPGTGKTLLAKAIATETDANFILVNGPELLSKWVGESEKAVRRIFEKARQVAPSIIFFDEMDSIAPLRNFSSDSNVTERIVNQLLTEISGLRELQNIVVIAATNRPDLIDTALLRPGRFDRVILLPLPSKEARLEIFRIHTSRMKLHSDVKLEKLSEMTEGYVGADLELVCMEAAIQMLRKNLKHRTVKMDNFLDALGEVGPSVTGDIQRTYEEFEQQFRKKKAKEMQSYLG